MLETRRVFPVNQLHYCNTAVISHTRQQAWARPDGRSDMRRLPIITDCILTQIHIYVDIYFTTFLPGIITWLCLDTVSARMGVGQLLSPAQLPGTH